MAGSGPWKILFIEKEYPDMEIAGRECEKGGLKTESRRGEAREYSLENLESSSPDAVVSAYSLAVLDGMAAPPLTRAEGPLKASKPFKEIEYSPECRLRLPAGIL